MVVRETEAMIAGMDPVRRPGMFVFITSDDATLRDCAVAMIREDEGISLVVPLEAAVRAGFSVPLPMACVTLRVTSALDGVGLTAAVATALAEEGIACNMIAGHHHDYAFVPEIDADRAIAVLRARAAREIDA